MSARQGAQSAHIDKAFAAMSGQPAEGGQEEQQEDELFAQLDETLQKAMSILAQLKQGQQAPQQPGGEEPAGSPSQQGAV